jgi:hypothetical protein
MPYDFVVDQERQLLWVRYSGAVTVAERRAAAQHLLGEATNPDVRRFLLDYRSATSFITDEASGTQLAEYLVGQLAERTGSRVAWLVNYDHQLDPGIEEKTRRGGVNSARFRDLGDALAWLQQRDGGSANATDAAKAESPGTPLAIEIALGASHPVRSAHGTFEVKVAPQSPDNPPARAAAMARLSLDKRYSGPLDAVGRGEMLADGGGARKDGAYVAMERVSGTLHGHAGNFALVHRALMRNGAPEDWSVVVVPGSGTDALAGLEGSLRITVENGQHFYDMEYSLPG